VGFGDRTYVGPRLVDAGPGWLPEELAAVLEQVNGFVAFGGGFHLRGVCEEPKWHSLQRAWTGDSAFAARYAAVRADDVPLAQDALGDQFLLRGSRVYRLWAETGDVEALGPGLDGFLEAVQRDPIATLSLEPLQRFERDGGRLEPGELLAAYPPFCTKEAEDGVSLRAVPALDRLAWLADFAAQIGAAPEDGRHAGRNAHE
jgi:hypothetical protein